MFWQFPCITEGAAWRVHSNQPVVVDGGIAHVYVGLPWATWIDLRHKRAQTPLQDIQIGYQMRLAGARLQRLTRRLTQDGRVRQVRVHTVCQHVYWAEWLPHWQRMGITDLWLSHYQAEKLDAGLQGLTLHPWHLFAVNVEDSARSFGLRVGVSPQERRYLASFIGAHMPHYLSDVRLKLRTLQNTPGFLINVGDSWHFESVVYGQQIAKGSASPVGQLAEQAAIAEYNRVLSDSVFALCPAGAGPNTLRLWEALAVGAIPVLLGHVPVLPRGGSLPDVDWSEIVLRVPDADISRLPSILTAVSAEERSMRQKLGMQAYALVKAQRCF